MTGQLAWQEFWAQIQGAKQYSEELDRQLDFKNWLPRLSIKCQMEVLEYAPIQIVQELCDYIHPDVHRVLTGTKAASHPTEYAPIRWNISKAELEELKRRQHELKYLPRRKTRLF